MYEADGIDLASDEFSELCAIVAAERAGVLAEYIDRALYPGQPFRLFPDEKRSEVLMRLHAKGLVSGTVTAGSLFALRAASPLGRTWLADYYAIGRRDASEKRSTRRHEYLVAVISGSAGILLGMALEFAFGLVHLILG